MKYQILPKEYWRKQDFLLYVYDVLRDMLNQADDKELSSDMLVFKDENEAKEFSYADDMFHWLDTHGHHDKAVKLFNNHTFFSLLKDFCYYMYESVSCAERGKVTVAYSLLRKPIKDNLLYMEWLLADKEGFYNTFLYKSIDEYDVSNWNVFDKNRINQIIKDASQKTWVGDSVNTDNLVYTFRFNSKDKTGLQKIWNKSMHLVTRSTNYKTEEGNLNFLFADNEIWNDYWNYYYLVLPHLMMYVLEICEALFLEIVDVDNLSLLINRIIRFEKYIEFYPEIKKKYEEIDKLKEELIDLIIESKLDIGFICEHCGSKIFFNEEILRQMIDNWYVICASCENEHNICKYYTETINKSV